MPLVRVPKTLPTIRNPDEVEAHVLSRQLRTYRDRAMVFAMLFGRPPTPRDLGAATLRYQETQ